MILAGLSGSEGVEHMPKPVYEEELERAEHVPTTIVTATTKQPTAFGRTLMTSNVSELRKQYKNQGVI